MMRSQLPPHPHPWPHCHSEALQLRSKWFLRVEGRRAGHQGGDIPEFKSICNAPLCVTVLSPPVSPWWVNIKVCVPLWLLIGSIWGPTAKLDFCSPSQLVTWVCHHCKWWTCLLPFVPWLDLGLSMSGVLIFLRRDFTWLPRAGLEFDL